MGLRPPETCDIMHPSVALRYTQTSRTANLYLNLPTLRMANVVQIRVESRVFIEIHDQSPWSTRSSYDVVRQWSRGMAVARESEWRVTEHASRLEDACFLQHTATHCQTTHCNALLDNTLQYTILQHTATC